MSWESFLHGFDRLFNPKQYYYEEKLRQNIKMSEYKHNEQITLLGDNKEMYKYAIDHGKNGDNKVSYYGTNTNYGDLK